MKRTEGDEFKCLGLTPFLLSRLFSEYGRYPMHPTPYTQDGSRLTALCLYVCAILAFSSGCSRKPGSTETRRDYSVAFLQENYLPSRHIIQQKIAREALPILQDAKTAIGNPPIVTSAVLIVRSNGTGGLYFAWVQDQVTVDGVRVQFGTTSSPKTFTFDSQQVEQNREAAKRGVLFSGTLNWSAESELAHLAADAVANRTLTATLLCGSSTCSKDFDLEVFSLGRWIESPGGSVGEKK